MTAVGAGRMPVAEILAASPAAEWHVVELDRCATDMMTAVADSLTWLAGQGLSRAARARRPVRAGRRRRRRLRHHQPRVPAQPDVLPRPAGAVLRRPGRGAGQGAGRRVRRARSGRHRGQAHGAPGRGAGRQPDRARRARRGHPAGAGRGQARLDREAAGHRQRHRAAAAGRGGPGRAAARLRPGHRARRGAADRPAADRTRARSACRRRRWRCCRIPGRSAGTPIPEFLFQPGAGPLFDMGPYYLSALATLFGPAEQVAADRPPRPRPAGSSRRGPRAGHGVRRRGAHPRRPRWSSTRRGPRPRSCSASTRRCGGTASWRSPAPRPPWRCPTRTGSTARSGSAPPAATAGPAIPAAGATAGRGLGVLDMARAAAGRRPAPRPRRAGAARARDHGGDRPVGRRGRVRAGADHASPSRTPLARGLGSARPAPGWRPRDGAGRPARPRRRHGRLRVHGRGPLAGLADRAARVRPAAAARHGGAVRPGRRGRGGRRRAGYGWAGRGDRLARPDRPRRRPARRHLHARATRTPRSRSPRWTRASTCCARSRSPTPLAEAEAMAAAAGAGRGPRRPRDDRLQLPPGARPLALARQLVADGPDRRDPARPRRLPAGLAGRPGRSR